MKETKHFLKIFLGTLGLFLVTVLLLYVFFNRDNKSSVGSKEIVIKVIVPDEEVQVFTLSTDAITLRQALDEENLIRGTGDTGSFFITEVNKRRAEDSKQEWWSITKGGEYIEFGVDMINIQDKDQYELTLMEGY